jgi:hypothetical protein
MSASADSLARHRLAPTFRRPITSLSSSGPTELRAPRAGPGRGLDSRSGHAAPSHPATRGPRPLQASLAWAPGPAVRLVFRAGALPRRCHPDMVGHGGQPGHESDGTRSRSRLLVMRSHHSGVPSLGLFTHPAAGLERAARGHLPVEVVVQMQIAHGFASPARWRVFRPDESTIAPRV